MAEEVRSLARRTGDAVQETSRLLEECRTGAEHGVQVSKEAGTAFTEIRGRSTGVAQILDEIAHSTREQAQGIEQVNAAMSSMDVETQATSSAADEAAASSNALSERAHDLELGVGVLLAILGGAKAGKAVEATDVEAPLVVAAGSQGMASA